MLLKRAVESRYRETVASRRVTVVTGPRQSGKTTLVQSQLAGTGTFRTLDDRGVLDAALADPSGFVTLGQRPLVIDEIQRGGDALVGNNGNVDRRDTIRVFSRSVGLGPVPSPPQVALWRDPSIATSERSRPLMQSLACRDRKSVV